MKLCDLKIGDVIYRINEKNNSFSRTKIHKVIDGEDWFRYSSNVRTYELSEVVLCGIIKKDVQGELPSDLTYEKDNEYYVKNAKDEIYELEEFSINIEETDAFFRSSYYLNKEYAMRVLNKMNEKAREIDLNGTVGEH